MVRAGWLRGERGRTGGLQLAVSPSRLSVGDVVEHFEGKIALLECVHHRGVCVIEPVCRLRCVLAAAGDRLVRDLKQVTLDRLAGTDTGGLLQLGEEEGDRRPMRHGHSPNSPHGTRGRRER
jgi:Rrf2 family nitric oxide-sensitive transcriptional repressor